MTRSMVRVHPRPPNMHITILLGTTRIGAHSLRVAHEIARALKKTPHEVSFFDLSEFNAPSFTGAYLNVDGMNPLQKKMHEEWRASHLVIIVTPEYHGGMPGSLKNLFDVLAKSDLHNNKVYSCVGVSNGRGGLKAIQAVQASLINLINSTKARAYYTTQMLIASHVEEIFDEKGILKDAAFSQRIQDYLDRILPQAEKWTS